MVDCYLTTFHNQRGYFGDRSKVAKEVVEHPERFHIYAGLASMTNISRYDLPDPETYRQFFGAHPLQEFPTLQVREGESK